MEYAIEVRDLVKRYSGRNVVDGVSFSVRRGTVFALLGPNGAGKTTAIEILECLRTPTSGSAIVLGYSVGKSRRDEQEIKRRIGIMPQEFKALDKLTVRENMVLFSRLYDRHRDIDGLIREFGLEEHSNIRFERLSGGLRQRLGLALAVINDPEVIFLDEPTTGLDPASRRGVWDMIRAFKASGKTVVLTSHYMEEVEYLADEVAVMHRGRIVATGSPGEIAGRYGLGRRLVIHGCTRSKGLASLVREYGVVGDTLVLSMDDIGSIPISEIVDMAIRDGLEVQFRNPSLEDAFLRLVGRMDEEGRLINDG
ncbi:MAG: ABC transporter ATP-binding protein [Candidatus Nitrosocaldus sp.]|nr:ABC transporter ATP-binding protein [Candidatus Nitrosocaldus sp.]MDW8000638.1 ABC transporter ATP-binding protein [Candidatus Nitrosocaldus sp.]